jgi:predicted ATPase
VGEARLARLPALIAPLLNAALNRCFLEAIEIARRQRARSFELRAATRLSRLWADRGNVSGARALLSEIYDWFTEGFDTADLSEARAPLEELGGRARTSRASTTRPRRGR